MPQTWDTVVLGAGVFGLATARALTQMGQRVLALDRAPVGTEASGWALGRIDPLLRGSGSTSGAGDEGQGVLSKTAAQSRLALKAYADHMNALGQLESETGIDLQFDEQPTVQLLYSPEERLEGTGNAQRWTELGFKSEVVGPDAIKALDARYDAPEYGAVVVNGPFFIDSLSFARALEASARTAGVTFQTAVASGITADGGGVTVHTDQGHYAAGAAVVALGPWTGEFCLKLGANVPVTPSKGEILRMSLPEGGPFGHHLHGPCSLVNKKDGQVWVAATAANDGFNREPTQWATDRLLANARQMMPSMRAAKILQHTVCFRPATPDDMPIVGRLPIEANAWVASGGGGSGIVQCLAIGAETAGMVGEGRAESALPGISLGRFG